jgi:hypothetical protein
MADSNATILRAVRRDRNGKVNACRFPAKAGGPECARVLRSGDRVGSMPRGHRYDEAAHGAKSAHRRGCKSAVRCYLRTNLTRQLFEPGEIKRQMLFAETVLNERGPANEHEAYRSIGREDRSADKRRIPGRRASAYKYNSQGHGQTKRYSSRSMAIATGRDHVEPYSSWRVWPE